MQRGSPPAQHRNCEQQSWIRLWHRYLLIAGDALNQPDGADGDQVVLVYGLGVIFLKRIPTAGRPGRPGEPGPGAEAGGGVPDGTGGGHHPPALS